MTEGSGNDKEERDDIKEVKITEKGGDDEKGQ